MNKGLIFTVLFVVIFSFSLIFPTSTAYSQPIIADHNAVTEFGLIPDSVFTAIGTDYEILYKHTSHGSQIMSGITLIEAEFTNCVPPPFTEPGDDLGHNGDTSWVENTRYYLEHASYDFNMAIFSWCGGVSDNTEEGIDIYLAKMEELEADYPNVIFIYMTGHLDGGGIAGNLYLRNNQIRDYCTLHNKILFDFADIESWDPDGNYYPDESDACAWCTDWCLTHTCATCSCAHSHCFNCYLKGKAWWWMMAKISGWNSSSPPDICGDADGSGEVDISDAVYLIDYIFGGGPAPDPLAVGDADCSGAIDISDAVYLITYIFGSGPAPCDACP